MRLKSLEICMNEFCYSLKLPFNLDTTWLAEQQLRISGSPRIVNIAVPQDRHDSALVSWCHTVGIEIAQQELIYTPAGGWGKPHVDLAQFSNLCKINWVFGGGGSVMNWYQVRSDYQGETVSNTVNTFYRTFHTDHLEQIYSSAVAGPTLLNVGIPHNVENPGSQERWAITTVFKNTATGTLLMFRDAAEKLNNYILR
jgi:hypothetical protein